jgi:hypothetical protein
MRERLKIYWIEIKRSRLSSEAAKGVRGPQMLSVSSRAIHLFLWQSDKVPIVFPQPNPVPNNKQ